MRANDVVVTLGGAPVTSVADLHRLLNSEAIGAASDLGLVRDGRLIHVSVRPTEAPSVAAR